MKRDETTVPLLDRAHLNGLKDRSEGCRELIQAFLTTTEPLLQELAQARQQRNEPEFREILHALLGAAKSVGAQALADCCQSLVEDRNREPPPVGLDALAACFQHTHTALVAFLDELPVAMHPSPRAGGAQKTLLLVEDNATARQLIHVALTDDYRLLDAENGEAALARCAEEPSLDGALVDLNLGSAPHSLSGLEVIHRMPRTIPVIVLTVDRSRDSIQAAVRAGAWAYLIKPPDPDTLRATLCAVLARSREIGHQDTRDVLNVATGLIMAIHHLDQPDARRLLLTLAAAQRRKAIDLADELIAAQHTHQTLARCAQQLRTPSEAPPS